MTSEHNPVPASGEGAGPETAGRRRFLGQAAAAAAVGIAAASTVGYVATRGPVAAKTLVSAFHAGDLPIDDPLSPLWLDREMFLAKMVKQNITTPAQQTVEVPEVRVRSLHNGKLIAFHLQWSDATDDHLESIAVFRDAVAVQLEVDPANAPSFTMGNPEGPVHILQWRASWQSDIDTGHKGVKDLFPNAYNDVTPEGLMPKDAATKFYPARVAGNRNAERERTSPVEELTAVGFGSLTSHDTQQAVGSGVHKSGRWQVVIAIPMNGTDKTKATVKAGETRNVAFAVWNGSKGQRGARKQYYPWTTIDVEAVR